MRVLIIGSKGFYGSNLINEFKQNGYEVIASDLVADENTVRIDILNCDTIRSVLLRYVPDIIINMAGQANVAASWNNPQKTVQLNTIGFINILDVVKSINNRIRVIGIGSSDEYGDLKEFGTNVTEETPLNPITPYAISKQAQEQFAKLYVNNHKLDICMVRQFNLGGAGQSKGFMISDFASGIVEIENGKRQSLLVGNLESARDFLHVKDACVAIRLIAEKGHSGEIYNVCSGNTFNAREILNKLIRMANCDIDVQVDFKRMRPSDTPVICGSHEKLTIHTGWEPKFSIDEILKDSLAYWRKQM